MKETVDVTEYAGLIAKALPKGILLNTKNEKFNSMVIGWGGLGTTWSRPTFTVLVRENRYTKAPLDATGEFTISVPLEKPIPLITKVCGVQSGHDVDKVEAAHLTLVEPEVVSVPAIKEYPLTLECKVLYAQPLDLSKLPDDIREKMYPQDVDGSYHGANRDAHTVYVGEIVASYLIK
ncbi:flavin reductase family protein [Collinsella vaginalis]|uniref:flavin reductase family protein n=1 Tax=Collinsella vaginalis TaxID=1870987 RepID=UPI000A26CC17|nr:flavin reductase [Collinsella vaginalis]